MQDSVWKIILFTADDGIILKYGSVWTIQNDSECLKKQI